MYRRLEKIGDMTIVIEGEGMNWSGSVEHHDATVWEVSGLSEGLVAAKISHFVEMIRMMDVWVQMRIHVPT